MAQAATRAAPSREVSSEVADHHDLDEEADQEQYDGRDIDTAEVRHSLTDWPQQRLGDRVEDPPQRAHELVVGVYDVEADQPAHNGVGKENVNVEADDGVSEVK